jgi:hypothetical protein
MNWIGLAGLVLAAVSLAYGFLQGRKHNRAIRQEQADRKDQIEAAWAFEWAAQRPLVYPVLLPVWLSPRWEDESPYTTTKGQLLPVKNGGRGPALNVSGTVITISSTGVTQERQMVAGTIAAGDLLDARLTAPEVDDWSTVRGKLEYHDLVGGHYLTPFTFSKDPEGVLSVTIDETTHIPPGAGNAALPHG